MTVHLKTAGQTIRPAQYLEMSVPDSAEQAPARLADVFEAEARRKTVRAGTVLAGQGEPKARVFRVTGGIVRRCVYTAEGHRKILQFAGPGAFLGLGPGERWTVTLEAVGKTGLQSMPRRLFDAAIAARPALQEELSARLAAELAAREALLVLVAYTHAADRVRCFLESFAGLRDRGAYVSLPMGRRDIADHLGLSMETVSRSFSLLRERGEIELRGAAEYRLLPRFAGTCTDGMQEVA